jgi:glycosyltransferase involved in cell wall biosynthesis
MAAPMFSIILATLNVETTLAACLDSVLRQTYSDFELIIVDGCSTDGTLDVANSCAPNFANHVVIDSARDENIYDAWNRGVGLATGEWLYHLGADDVLYEADTLARVASFIDEHQPVDLVYGDVMRLSTSTRTLLADWNLDRLLFSGNICHQSIFYRHELFDRIGPYSLRYPIAGDWDFNIRCFANPALVIHYMDIVVVLKDDMGGLSSTGTDLEFIKRVPACNLVSGREINRDLDDPRLVFYLGMGRFDWGDLVVARKWFERRLELGGWDEETYFTMYRLAQTMLHLGEPWHDVQDAYLKAWEFRPTRAEPLYAIACWYRAAQRYRLGYLFAKLAAEIPVPEQDTLFVSADVHTWRATDEQAVCASWIGKQAESFTLNRRMLARPDVPDPDRERIAANRDVCAPTMIEAASAYPDAQVQSLQRMAAGSGNDEVVVSVVAGPDLARVEHTLNSFLNCCTDVSRVTRFLGVDGGLSAKDRAKLLERYGFLEFADSRPPDEPDEPGAQLARIHAQIDARLWLHLGQDWRFFAPENFITRLTAVLDAEQQVFQVGINFGDAVKLTGASAAERAVRRAPDAGRYVLTDVVATGPAMFDTARLERAGGVHAADRDVIAAMARRAAAAGLRPASLDEVMCIAEV